MLHEHVVSISRHPMFLAHWYSLELVFQGTGGTGKGLLVGQNKKGAK